jgi:hypothetical protein
MAGGEVGAVGEDAMMKMSKTLGKRHARFAVDALLAERY